MPFQAVFDALTSPGPSSTCSWPLHPISQSRDLDLTQCFEHAVVLPVPLGIALIAGSAQIISKRRRLKWPEAKDGLVWTNRSRASERVCRIKVVGGFRYWQAVPDEA